MTRPRYHSRASSQFCPRPGYRGQGTRGARARASGAKRTTSPPGDSQAGRGEGPRAPRAPGPTFLDSGQLGLVDGDFSHVGPGSRPPLAARFPAAAGPESGPARSSSARRGAKSGRQRAPTWGRSGRRGRASDKGGGRTVPAPQAGGPATPPQPPALAPPAPIDTKYPEPGNGPGPSSTEGERRQKGRRAGRRAGGPGWGGGGELQVCNRNCKWLASEDRRPRPPPCCLLCAVRRPRDWGPRCAPAPGPCLPIHGGSRLSVGLLCPEGLNKRATWVTQNIIGVVTGVYSILCSGSGAEISCCLALSQAFFASWD